jgi:hypothetical protein
MFMSWFSVSSYPPPLRGEFAKISCSLPTFAMHIRMADRFFLALASEEEKAEVASGMIV